MRDKSHSFNASITDKQYNELGILAQAFGVSKAQVIRQLIDACADMKLRGIPLCVTSQQCYTPHLHTAANIRQTRLNDTETNGETPL